MEKNAQTAVEMMTKTGISALRRHLLSEFDMRSEFSFINIDANDPVWQIVDRLWKTLIFRPDVASRVEQLCRGPDILLQPFADLLREAIDAGDWPQDLW